MIGNGVVGREEELTAPGVIVDDPCELGRSKEAELNTDSG